MSSSDRSASAEQMSHAFSGPPPSRGEVPYALLQVPGGEPADTGRLGRGSRTREPKHRVRRGVLGGARGHVAGTRRETDEKPTVLTGSSDVLGVDEPNQRWPRHAKHLGYLLRRQFFIGRTSRQDGNSFARHGEPRRSDRSAWSLPEGPTIATIARMAARLEHRTYASLQRAGSLSPNPVKEPVEANP